MTNGTEKQINWANKIQATLLDRLESFKAESRKSLPANTTPAQVEALEKRMADVTTKAQSIDDAQFWIAEETSGKLFSAVMRDVLAK